MIIIGEKKSRIHASHQTLMVLMLCVSVLSLLMTTVKLVADEQNTEASGSIQGFVCDGTTRERIPGITIIYVGPAGIKGKVTTDEKGKFKIKDLPPGSYVLSVEHESYHPRKNLPTKVVSDNDTFLGIDLFKAEIEPSYNLEVLLKTRPTLPIIHIGFRPFKENPIFMLKVSTDLIELNGKKIDIDELKAAIENKAQGSRHLTVELAVGDDVPWEKVVSILESAMEKGNLDIRFHPSNLPDQGEKPKKNIIGFTVDSKGKPVPGVKVEVYGRDGLIKTIFSSAKRQFNVNEVLEGIYTLNFTKDGFMSWKILVLVEPNVKKVVQRFLMLKIDEELPAFNFSPPFPVNLPAVEQIKMKPVMVEPVVYINADGKIAVDDKTIPEIHSLYDADEKMLSNISMLYDEIMEKSLMNSIIIAADNETRWEAISAVMNEEVMRGAIGVNLMVKLRD